MKKTLPIFLATIADLQDGIWDVSLVDQPATEKLFTCFSEQEPVKLEFKTNEELHWVSGPVMLPDTPIYRRNPDGFEYYIMYNKETIRQMAEKLMKDGLQNVVTRNHDEQAVEGVSMVELFIKDSTKGIDPSYTDVPDGTLMASYKVENPEVWEQIKSGEFLGFSLSGYFTAQATGESKQLEYSSNHDRDLDKIIDLLQDIKQYIVQVAKR